jgi:excisionase family DNA binding protein
MADSPTSSASRQPIEAQSARITVEDIARRLDVGRLAVYAMLEQGIIPGIRFASTQTKIPLRPGCVSLRL